jgi:NAD(P)-dependent dehydrogenase (short-subunit alcohol dehydrogenase family)
MELADRIVIVTGAASGIGRATAIRFAEAGVRAVVLADLQDVGETEASVRAGGAEPFPLQVDVGELSSLRAMIDATLQRYGRLDVLHNNAGMGEGPAAWPGADPERCAAIVDVNLRAVVLGTQLALEPMQRSGGGVIVNTSSGAAFVPLAQQAVYAATKAGVVHFTRSCSALAESHGVRMNCVCPGLVDTPMILGTGDDGVAPWLQPLVEAVELLRPEAVAEAVLALVRDDACVAEVVTLDNAPKA